VRASDGVRVWSGLRPITADWRRIACICGSIRVGFSPIFLTSDGENRRSRGGRKRSGSAKRWEGTGACERA
jgi:hypothetical protein